MTQKPETSNSSNCIAYILDGRKKTMTKEKETYDHEKLTTPRNLLETIENDKNTQYPECERLALVSDKMNSIRYFLHWLANTKEIYLSQYKQTVGYDSAASFLYCGGLDELLNEFFELDPNKIEEERRSMIISTREW